jgi:hypothetical protein
VPKKERGGTRPQGVVPLLSKGPPLSGGPLFIPILASGMQKHLEEFEDPG